MNAQKCDPVLRPFAGYVLDRCDDRQLEVVAERAAVLEFEAGCQPRALAEALAILDLLRQSPSLLTGVVVLEVRQGDATQWLLTTDQKWTGTYAEACDGSIVAVHDPATVLSSQYGGVALLGTLG